jgi:hypothetical protein
MSTIDFIIDLFCRVDEVMPDVPKHPQANLYPSEIVTLALLFALKGVGPRRFYRWLVRDYRPLFPTLPDRTRLFRLFATHADWSEAFLAAPTVLGGPIPSASSCATRGGKIAPMGRSGVKRCLIIAGSLAPNWCMW